MVELRCAAAGAVRAKEAASTSPPARRGISNSPILILVIPAHWPIDCCGGSRLGYHVTRNSARVEAHRAGEGWNWRYAEEIHSCSFACNSWHSCPKCWDQGP